MDNIQVEALNSQRYICVTSLDPVDPNKGCQICNKIAVEHITSCSNKHLTCLICHRAAYPDDSIPKCLTCKEPVLMAEHSETDYLLVRCPFIGCSVEVTGANALKHMNGCDKRDPDCKYHRAWNNDVPTIYWPDSWYDDGDDEC